MSVPILYRALAAYKTHFRDPRLDRAARLWFLIALPALAITWMRDRFDLPFAIDIASRVLFAALLLLSALLAVSFYDEFLRNSKVGFTGVCVGLGLASPAFSVAISHRMLGTGIPSGGMALALGAMMMCGIIGGCVLVAIALSRNGNAND